MKKRHKVLLCHISYEMTGEVIMRKVLVGHDRVRETIQLMLNEDRMHIINWDYTDFNRHYND